MTGSATPAPPSESRPTEAQHILERLEQWREDNPEASVYVLADEQEAADLLLAMAATMKLVAKDLGHDKASRDTIQGYAKIYRKAVMQGKALEYFRTLTEEDELSLYGVKITAPRIILA